MKNKNLQNDDMVEKWDPVLRPAEPWEPDFSGP